MATYYDDTQFTLPRRAVQEKPSDWTKQSIVNDNSFSVRWAGSIQTAASNSGAPSVFVVNAHAGERYRLYVDQALVIDKWATAAGGGAATTSGTIVLNAANTDFYNILLEYVSSADNAMTGTVIDLRVGTTTPAIVPTDNLYRRDLITGVSKRLRVNPNIACSVTSTHRGVGLTLATAGLQAVFTITSIDAYGNQRGIGGDMFVVRAFPLGSSTAMVFPELGNTVNAYTFHGCASCCLACPPLVRASVIDRKDNTYLVSYTPTKRGDYKMISSLARPGGLTSTVYASAYNPDTNVRNFGAATTTLLQNSAVDFSVAANAALPGLISDVGTWRWQGFVQPSKAAQYTFYVALKHSSERCRLWIDNNLVLTATGASLEVSATFGFGLANSLYDLDVIYYTTNSASANHAHGISLKWQSLGSIDPAHNAINAVIPSSSLWSRHDIENMDIPNGDASATAKNWMVVSAADSVERKLFVRPAIGCASTSTAVGMALTLATAGLPSTFTLFSKDMWQNSRTIQNDMVWVGTAFGSGGVPTVLASVGNIQSSTVSGVATSSVFTTTAAHGLTVGDSIQFSVPNFINKKLPTELAPNTYYFVLTTPTTTTFTITATRGGTTYAVADYSTTTFDVETNAYRVSYTINAAKQYSFFTKSSNYNAMNSPFALTVVPHRQCGTQSTVFGNGISSAAFNSVTAFTIVARDFYGNRRTIANDGSATPDDIYLASIVYSSVPSPAPWSYNSVNSVDTFTVAPVVGSGTETTSYIVQATTVQGTGSGAVFKVSLASGAVIGVAKVVGGYGYVATTSVLKLFKESFGSPASGDITITVTAVIANTPGQSAVMVTTPCASSCNNAVPTSVGDGTYTGAYTLTSMPPGAAYAGAYFRAFLAVKGGLMATFYKTETDPGQNSPGGSSYVQASSLFVTDPTYAFTCSPNCYAAARFHGFFKTSACSPSHSFVIASGTSRTYLQGQLKVDGWATAAASTEAVTCTNGQYIEFFQETRSGSTAGSHNSLLKWDFTSLVANVFGAYAISNTPVPLTVTQ